MMSTTVAILLLCCFSKADETIFTVDFNQNSLPIWKFWERYCYICILHAYIKQITYSTLSTSGTTFDHAYVALRQDWRDQLLQTHQDLNIEWVRFHNILDDDIGIVNAGNPSLPYSYINVDKIYDYIYSIGMKPLVELDFMPSSFVPSTQRSRLYQYPVYAGPPNNYTQWYEFIKSFVEHITDRYGSDIISSWSFDAWNEPNSGANNWQDHNLETFEKTWNQTARAIKAVNKSYFIGGPGSEALGWIPDFPQWCKDHDVPLDFVSTHMYPTHGDAEPTHNGFLEILKNLSAVVKGIDSKLKIALTAWGCTTAPGPGKPGPHDTNYNAACYTTFASQFQELDNQQYNIMSFTGFTDLWDQEGSFSAMFHDGYGWMTDRGVKKPTYHAMKLLVDYASDRDYYKVYRNNSDEVNTTLELMTTISNDKKQITLFVMNWMLNGYPIKNETVIIDLVNLGKIYNGDLPGNGIIYRIDEDNCNPLKTWESMGSPIYPTQEEIDRISNSSVVIGKTINVESKSSDTLRFKLNVPVYGMAVIVIDL